MVFQVEKNIDAGGVGIVERSKHPYFIVNLGLRLSRHMSEIYRLFPEDVNESGTLNHVIYDEENDYFPLPNTQVLKAIIIDHKTSETPFVPDLAYRHDAILNLSLLRKDSKKEVKHVDEVNLFFGGDESFLLLEEITDVGHEEISSELKLRALREANNFITIVQKKNETYGGLRYWVAKTKIEEQLRDLSERVFDRMPKNQRVYEEELRTVVQHSLHPEADAPVMSIQSTRNFDSAGLNPSEEFALKIKFSIKEQGEGHLISFKKIDNKLVFTGAFDQNMQPIDNLLGKTALLLFTSEVLEPGVLSVYDYEQESGEIINA